MSEIPDLLLVYYDQEPENKDAFLKSLFADLQVSIGPVTRFILCPKSNATDFTDTLVDATVRAMKYFEQYSLENDSDRMAYQLFTSFSPKEGKRIRGYLFKLYGKGSGRTNTPGPLGDKLYIGMPFEDIVQLLGEPSRENPGTEQLEGGPNYRVIISEETRNRLAHTRYCMWNRPEGTYLLVIENNKLASIYRKP